MSANGWCFSVNTREVNQPPQTLTLRAAHDQVFRLTPLGMKDSRTKRSPPVLPPLASTQLPHGSQPSCNSGFPHAVMLAHIFREVSGVVSGAHAAGCVSVQVQAAAWLGIVWAPPSGSRHSPVTAGRLTTRGLVSPRSKGSERGYVSVRPVCRPTLGPIQASCLVIGPDAHVQGSRAEL